MELSLSSAALPEADLKDLLEACVRRGIGGLELVAGGAHGVDPAAGPDAWAGARGAMERAGVRAVGIFVADAALAATRPAARLAAALGAPVVTPLTDALFPQLAALDELFSEESGRLLLGLGAYPAFASALRDCLGHQVRALGLAWELDPAGDEHRVAPELLDQTGARLEYVRFRGGGPEAAEQAGLGVGTLMARLARSRYGGPLVLLPSIPAYRRAWSAWLGRAGGWGCGSRSAERPLTMLQPSTGP